MQQPEIVIQPKTNPRGGLAFVNPLFNGYCYARRATLSFFAKTPKELNPLCILVDDASPLYADQDWDFWFDGIPRDRCLFVHFPENGGLTRSWNTGLALAKEGKATYAIAGNSDVLFTQGWSEGLCHHLSSGASLVGPVTNAPGMTNSQRQNVRAFFRGYQVRDDAAYLEAVARYLQTNYPINTFHADFINGFFLMSTVQQWWEGSFDKQHIFDPRNRMIHNEDELERRWRRAGKVVGFTPRSFIFHYRAVSRGERHRHTGWCELDDPYKPV
jgi:GT2 family glycosyltransferase